MAAHETYGSQESDINLLAYWRVVWKWKFVVFSVILISVVVTGFYNHFMIVKTFESTATILAPKETGMGGMGGLASAILSGPGGGGGSFVGGLLSGVSGGTNRDTFLAILKSRTIAEQIVDRLRLLEHYGSKSLENAVRSVQGATDITLSREGVISIKVEDTDPKVAADIANAFVSNLDRLFVKMGTTEGTRQRAFVATRLEETERALHRAEEALRKFQEKNKTVALPEQMRIPLEAGSKLRAEITVAEVMLEGMRTYATENNPAIIHQKARAEELKRQLSQMQYGKGLELPNEKPNGNAQNTHEEFHVAVSKMPEMGIELARLTREFKVQEAMFALLTQQFEQAKIQEARDTPTVQPLDTAYPPTNKAKPRTIRNMEMAGAMSLLFGLFVAFFLEYIQRLRRQELMKRSVGSFVGDELVGARIRDGERTND
jgi:tyrosine-protein kinase Etk/Wzc